MRFPCCRVRRLIERLLRLCGMESVYFRVKLRLSIDYVEVSDIQHCDLSSIIAYSFIHTAILIISSSFFGFLMRDFDSLTAFVRIYVIASEHGMDKSKCEMSKNT